MITITCGRARPPPKVQEAPEANGIGRLGKRTQIPGNRIVFIFGIWLVCGKCRASRNFVCQVKKVVRRLMRRVEKSAFRDCIEKSENNFYREAFWNIKWHWKGAALTRNQAGRAPNYLRGEPPPLFAALSSKTISKRKSDRTLFENHNFRLERFNAKMPGTITTSSCTAFKVVAETVP